MKSITVRNVNDALPLALALLRDEGAKIAPRGQPTLEWQGPFATTYLMPDEMVLFSEARDANPFFHVFEALWILAGRDDVRFLAHFLPKMAEYSDNGTFFHGAYGGRLRRRYRRDQIEKAIDLLKQDRDTRQVVLSIWHPDDDLLGPGSKDIPCNDMIMLKVRDGKLRMTVCNRSNDVVWGAYGANVVQFSTMLLYIARRVGVGVGTYTQVSDSFHVYTDLPFWKAWREAHPAGVPTVHDPYKDMSHLHMSAYLCANDLIQGDFDTDMRSFFERFDRFGPDSPKLTNVHNYASDSFVEFYIPAFLALQAWRKFHDDRALVMLNNVCAPDWQLAMQRWLLRRMEKSQ